MRRVSVARTIEVCISLRLVITQMGNEVFSGQREQQVCFPLPWCAFELPLDRSVSIERYPPQGPTGDVLDDGEVVGARLRVDQESAVGQARRIRAEFLRRVSPTRYVHKERITLTDATKRRTTE